MWTTCRDFSRNAVNPIGFPIIWLLWPPSKWRDFWIVLTVAIVWAYSSVFPSSHLIPGEHPHWGTGINVSERESIKKSTRTRRLGFTDLANVYLLLTPEKISIQSPHPYVVLLECGKIWSFILVVKRISSVRLAYFGRSIDGTSRRPSSCVLFWTDHIQSLYADPRHHFSKKRVNSRCL